MILPNRAWPILSHLRLFCRFQTLWFSHPWKIGCLISVFIFIFWFWVSWCNICNTSSAFSRLLNCGGIRYALLGSDWCTQTCEIHKVGHGSSIANSVRLTTTGSIFICWKISWLLQNFFNRIPFSHEKFAAERFSSSSPKIEEDHHHHKSAKVRYHPTKTLNWFMQHYVEKLYKLKSSSQKMRLFGCIFKDCDA